MSNFGTISIPFLGGIDTKTDPKLVKPPYLTNLQNGIFNKGGTIKKRPGFTKLSNSINGGSNITSGQSIKSFNNELLSFDDNYMYSYSEQNQEWINKGTAISLKSSRQRIIRNDAEQTNQDMAICNNIALFAWDDSRGDIRASVIDLSTGVYYLNDVEVSSSGLHPKCISMGNYLFVLYTVGGTDIRIRRISCFNPTNFEAENTLITDLNSSLLYDVIGYDSVSSVLAYSNNENNITVTYVTYNGYLGVPGNGFLYSPNFIFYSASDCLTIIRDISSGRIYIGFHNSSIGTEIAAFNADLTVYFTPIPIDLSLLSVVNITGSFVDSANMVWFFEFHDSLSYNHVVWSNTMTFDGIAGTSSVFKRSVGLGSKCWLYNSRVYVNLTFDSQLQSTYFIFSHDGTILGKNLGTLGGGLTSNSYLPSVNQLSSGMFVWAALEKGKLRSDSFTVYSLLGVSMLTLDFTQVSRFDSSILGANIHIIGGILRAYDGAQLTEHGFHISPENIQLIPSSMGGSILSGTYGYKVCWEWTDSQGQTHQSATSPTQNAIVIGPTGSVGITIPTLRITSKNRILVTIYRTTASDSSTFYLITSISNPLLNDPTIDSVSFTDTFSDSSIISNQILYTVGGILDNDSPPPCSVITSGKKRLFLLDDENSTIWYTKQFVNNQGAAWSLGQQIILDGVLQGVKPKCLAIMDDKVIIFEKTRIFAFSGDGPNALGNGEFSIPELINTDVGCENPSSIVRTSIGLMFQSSKGIYLLDRSLQTSYIGANAEGFNSQTITSATLIENTNQIRFTTQSDIILLYDYYFDKWSPWNNCQANGATMWKGSYIFLTPSGISEQEDPNNFTNDGIINQLILETAWINLEELQGFNRIRRVALLGDLKSNHILTIQIGYDYQTDYKYSINFDTTISMPENIYGNDSPYGSPIIYGGSSDQVYQFRFRPPRQKCQSIRFRISDSNSTGENYSISGIDLEIMKKSGIARISKLKTL